MLIMKEQNAIFYHVYKVAGSSIRNALLPYGGKRQIYTQYMNLMLAIARLPTFPNPLYHYHPRLVDVRNRMGEPFYDYYRFAFVRDPFDWQKSLYFFMKKKSYLPGFKKVSDMSFSEYLTWRMDNEMPFQSAILSDGDERLVNDIFHFENINNDFQKVAGKLGLDISLPHLNKAGTGKSVEVSPDVLKRFNALHEEERSVLGYKST